MFGHQTAEANKPAAGQGAFPRHPEDSVGLSVSFPSGMMVKIFGPHNLIKEKERYEHNRQVQNNDGDPDVGHNINAHTSSSVSGRGCFPSISVKPYS